MASKAARAEPLDIHRPFFFSFNDGKGVRTNQLSGPFCKSVSAEADGSFVFTLQNAANQEVEVTIPAPVVGGGAPAPAPDPITVLLGLSDDNVPEASELTITAVNGVGTVPVFDSKYLLVARLTSEGDLTEATPAGSFSQFGAFSKHANTVEKDGLTYTVWVSNQLLTVPRVTIWTFS